MLLFGLIGFPLGHSFSKTYFTDKFEKEGLGNCAFELFPIPDIQHFSGLIQSQPNLKGLAVTIPYKEAVIPFLHQMSDEARMIGAVNCIQISDGMLTGYNTDVIGFEKSFSPLLGPYHKKALVLGTGGASKAVQFILKKMGIPFLLVSRNPAQHAGVIDYSSICKELLEQYTIIINCSPVGMSPLVLEKPAIPYEFITSQHYLYDLVYSPAETLFLLEGSSRGAVVKNGFDMLVFQAEENWAIWNITGSRQ